MSIYLDHAATTPLRPQAREAMEPFLGPDFGNPSGIHGISRRAKHALEEARAFMRLLRELEIRWVCVTAGSPYHNPHVQRPALFPPGCRIALHPD